MFKSKNKTSNTLKSTLSVLLMFLLVSSVTFTNFASGYEKENHYWLKIALALNCGFTLDEARLISIGDFSIDEDPDTQPVRSGSDQSNPKWKWHALPTNNPDVDKNEVSKGNQEIKQRQHQLYDRAMNENNTPMKLFKFGQYLHYQEDKWSHWGYTTGMGHAVPNVVPGMDSPDETHANPESYRYMVFDSMVNLGKLAKSLGKDTECVSDLVPLDTYKSAPEYGKDFPWFSPQEIKRIKDAEKFQKSVNKHLADWKKTTLIDEVITVSDKKGDDGVTDSFVTYVAKKTGISKSDIEKKYDYQHIDIDENGNAKTIPENLIKSFATKEKTSLKTSDPKKQTTSKTSSKNDSKQMQLALSADQIKTLYKTGVRNEQTMSLLTQIVKYEKNIINDAYLLTKKKYEETKNSDDQKILKALEQKLRELEKQEKSLISAQKTANKNMQSLAKSATQNGITKSALDKVKEKPSKITIDSPEKLETALKNIQTANKQNIKDLAKAFALPEKTILDDLLWMPSTDAKPKDAKVTPIPSNTDSFWDDFSDLSDHLPVKADFQTVITESEKITGQGKPGFEILLNPNSMVLPRGGYGEVAVTVKSHDGWKDPIWLNIPIPIGPIKYPKIIPNLVTPTPDATADFAVDVSEFSCPGKYRMAVYGMSQGAKMEIKYSYFNLEILPPGDIFELGSDKKIITVPKGGSGSFDLVLKNSDKHSWSFLVDTSDGFKAPTGVTVDYTQKSVPVESGKSNKAKVTITASDNVRTPMTFTLPMEIITALNCEPEWTAKTSVTINIVGQDSAKSDQILIPGTDTTTPKKPSNTKPTMIIPKQITQEATSSAGAAVNYSVSGQDKEDGSITPMCSSPSGSTFSIGTTTVNCTVTDSNGNSVSGTFTVTIRDTTPPNIPAFQPHEGVRDETGVQVFFDVTAIDIVDGPVPVSCNYPSGYKFPIGVTVLTCTADDSRGNHASRSLQITVTVTESAQ